ncbi:MAG TPA: YqaJ viral recombinase family protein [Ramlibacter sp.]
MKRLTFTQGSDAWHAHRATARNASDAPAMLGCSPYMTRSELLHARHTGLRAEPDAALARRYADGHAIEAAQREAAAALIGEPLYPVVGCEVVDGIELSASFDGLTMAEDIAYECKTLNDDLRAALPLGQEGNGLNLPKHYCVQMEQQLMVAGAERVLFVAATKDGSDVRACWYHPDPALRAEILAGWRQFDADLAAYVPPAASTVEKIVAEPVEALPSVVVQVAGSIAITDNFRAFEVALRDFLEHRLIREPKTDQDFADLDVQIKAMKGAEAALESAESQMLAQIQTVDQAKKTKDMLAKLVRDNRLMAEKLLKDEKERRRGEIVAAGAKALADHIAGLNARLGKPYMPTVPADFGGCIKGLKSLSSMEDKVATELARAKIAANEIADRIDANLKTLRELAAEYAFLFADTAMLVLKAPDDCRAQVEARIGAHKAEQERRAAELAERERARIRAEEEARAREQAQREQQEREAAERRQREETVARTEPQREPVAAPAPTANVLPMPTKAPTSAPTMRLGEINARLAPLSIDDAGLTALGFPPAATEKNAKLRHEADFPRICAALVQRLQAAARQQRAA